MFRWTKGLSFHLFLASKGGSRSFRTGPNKILEDRSFQDLKIAKRTSKDLFFDPGTKEWELEKETKVNSDF